MQKLELKIAYEEYASEAELEEKEKYLLQQAKQAVSGAYAPYSKFNVGAAVLLKNGEVIIGNNQENAASPSGLCAERVAVFAAGANHPSIAIEAIAITCKTNRFNVNEPIMPCGDCRQALLEYELRHESKIKLVLMGETGIIRVIESVSDLLPFVFNGKGLSK